MTTSIRMIATATVASWAMLAGGSALAQAPSASEPPAAATVPAPPPVAPASPPAPPAAPPSATQQGTPATVLDTQDYESLLGKSVRSANGDELGRVIDLIIDKEGRPRAAIIDFGGFLGVGSRKIAVDWRALRFTSDGKVGRLSLQLSRNQVRVSPEYKAGEPIVVLGPASPGPEGEQAAVPGPVQPAPTPPQSAPAASQAVPAAPPAALPVKPPVERAPDKAPDK